MLMQNIPLLISQGNPCITIREIPNGVVAMLTDERRRARQREASKRWRERNLEHARELDRIKARRIAADKAAAEGKEPIADLYRPKTPLLTEEEKRERRRVKSAKWRAENLERSREIVRESEKRRAAARAIAEGREPGKIGPPKKYTEEQKRALRKAKTEKYNAAHLEETRKYARERGQAIRDGTFVSRAKPRLTEEEKRLTNVAWAQRRREMVRKNGGTFTRQDIVALHAEQRGLCAICNRPFGDDGFHIDHWKPLVLGGTNDPSNLKLTHPTCNLRKGAHDPETFLDHLLPPSLVPPKET